jgi:lipoyl(octanoyl) transferase
MEDTSQRALRWGFLGSVPYAEAEGLQERLRQGLKEQQTPEHLLLLEHPPVYTLGRNADGADILATASWLAAQGVEVHPCDRGGQVTYHGPGQLVGYPILNLSPDRRDVRRYVQDLEGVLIRTLADYGLEAHVPEGQAYVGVWVGDAKIASIGVHLSRWITTHGFALNVTTDLGYFERIIPCGLSGVRMASIESLTGLRPSLEAVAERLAGHFREAFPRRLEPLEIAS